MQCLQKLGRLSEVDTFREAAVKKHVGNWQLLRRVGQSFARINHYGYIIAGEFKRGHNRGGGKYAGAFERDRVRALQLFEQARSALEKGKATNTEASDFYYDYAMLVVGNGYFNARDWKLGELSDLNSLPDYQEGHYYGHNPGRGAPVDLEGNPVFYRLPEDFGDATNDGERYRWLLQRAAALQPANKPKVDYEFARFLRSQFGVETMRRGYHYQPSSNSGKTSTYALHTLTDKETIARLASGIKRFTLPAEFNFVAIYQKLRRTENQYYARTAVEALASIYENRRLYPQAAKMWRESINRFGESTHRRQRLSNIIGDWGMFDPIRTQPAGRPGSLEFRFRNAGSVEI